MPQTICYELVIVNVSHLLPREPEQLACHAKEEDVEGGGEIYEDGWSREWKAMAAYCITLHLCQMFMFPFPGQRQVIDYERDIDSEYGIRI